MRLSFLTLIILFLTCQTRADDSDIRSIAPAKPRTVKSQIAAPESGASLNEVSADWARRQIHLSSGGADDQLIEDTNATLDRIFGLNSEAPHDSRAPASVPAEERSWLKPRSLHLSNIGEFELAFGSNTKLHCDLINANELTLSKPIFQDIDLRLHHENTLNSLQLKFNW
jgi:hypothetical protein